MRISIAKKDLKKISEHLHESHDNIFNVWSDLIDYAETLAPEQHGGLSRIFRSIEAISRATLDAEKQILYCSPAASAKQIAVHSFRRFDPILTDKEHEGIDSAKPFLIMRPAKVI